MEVRFIKVGLRLVCCALLLLAESAGSTRNAMHGRAMHPRHFTPWHGGCWHTSSGSCSFSSGGSMATTLARRSASKPAPVSTNSTSRVSTSCRITVQAHCASHAQMAARRPPAGSTGLAMKTVPAHLSLCKQDSRLLQAPQAERHAPLRLVMFSVIWSRSNCRMVWAPSHLCKLISFVLQWSRVLQEHVKVVDCLLPASECICIRVCCHGRLRVASTDCLQPCKPSRRLHTPSVIVRGMKGWEKLINDVLTMLGPSVAEPRERQMLHGDQM